MRRASFLYLLAVALAPACAPSTTGNGDDDDDGNGLIDGGSGNGFIDARPGGEFVDAGNQMMGACEKVDILFVIDNSGSMGEEQTNLIANFPMFATLIETYMNSAGATLDYHVGITTTDAAYDTTITFPGIPPIVTPSGGNDGKLITGSGCNMPRAFLQRGDANVPTIFSCAANVGTNGDGNEMPLEVAKRALVDHAMGANSGFLREDALLAIVFITDEEDCSHTATSFDALANPLSCGSGMEAPATSYLTHFDNVKGGERGRWAAAVIAGPGPGVCSSAFGSADESVRLKEFVTAGGTNLVFSSICDGDLASSLADAFMTFGEACEGFPPID